MIDSIHIRLNNIKSYPTLLQYLLLNATRTVNTSEAQMPDNKNMLNFNLTYVNFTNEHKVLVDVKGEKLTSSHYTLAYHLPLAGKLGYCDFNFSIPKLLYGTNIIQFVIHHEREFRDFGGFAWGDYKANQEATYRRLVFFIKRFFKTYLTRAEREISLNDIEIRRIDICFNQYFNSKREALEYLNYQKNIKKKNLRYTSKNQTGFPTSVFYNTEDYGCKIYHKGSEYRSRSGEMHKHLEINRQIEANKDRWVHNFLVPKRNIKFNVEKLAENADKILRYEITFRNSYLSKIFWSKVFRRKNEGWQKRMKKYNEIRRIDEAATSKSKKNKHLREFYFDVFMGKVKKNDSIIRKHIYDHQWKYKFIDLESGLNKADRVFYRWWTKQKQRRVSFRLAVDERVSDIQRGLTKISDIGNGIEPKLPREAMFSRTLLKRCFKIFDEFRDYFEIKEKTYLSDVVKKVDLYNENIEKYNSNAVSIGEPRKKQVRLGKVKSVLALMQSGYTLEDLVKRGIIDRTTAWRYEKKFKDVDIRVNLHSSSMVTIPNCRDFTEYHRCISWEGLERYLNNAIFR